MWSANSLCECRSLPNKLRTKKRCESAQRSPNDTAQGGITGMYYITDTSRNAAPASERQDCSNWCNINNSGFGLRPSNDTSVTGLGNLIDAFAWIKGLPILFSLFFCLF